MQMSKIRIYLCFFLVFFFSLMIFAQEEEIQHESEFFSMGLILDALEFANTSYYIWQPDWPLELPPDAFRVSGDVRKITVETEDFSYNIELDLYGRMEAFPLMLNSSMVQIQISYMNNPGGLNSPMEISEIRVFFDEETWVLEVLELKDIHPIFPSYPSLLRVFREGSWFFINFFRGGNRLIETWFDIEGEAVGVYGYSLITVGDHLRIRSVRDHFSSYEFLEYDYNSRGLVSSISGSPGSFSALYYRDDLPRYWERAPSEHIPADEDMEPSPVWYGSYSYQWDEQDTLLRLTGETFLNEPVYTEHRYEYTLDERGNWIERRETRMLTNMGLLIPSAGTTVRRNLEYYE